MSEVFINIPSGGARTWKDPVANAAALPLTGNNDGDVRLTLDTHSIYYWDGAAWQLFASGTGGINSVTVGPTLTDTGTPTDPNLNLAFPILAPNGSAADPSYGFAGDTGTDTGMYTTGDGNLSFSTNAVLALSIDASQNVTITGNISAANYPPLGTANHLAQYDGSGVLTSAANWQITGDGGLAGTATLTASNINYLDINTDGTAANDMNSVNINSNTTVSQNYNSIRVTNTGAVTNDFSFLNSYNNADIGQTLRGTWLSNDGAVHGSFNAIVSDNNGNIDGNYNGIQLGTNGTVGSDFNFTSFFNNGAIAGNANLLSASNNGSVGGDLNLVNVFNQNTAPIANNFRHFVGGNNGDVGGFSSGINIFDNNTITKGSVGFGYYHNGNVGDGTVGVSLVDGNMNGGTIDAFGNIFNFQSNANWTNGINGLNLNFNGSTIAGNLNMVNVFNQADITGTNSFIGVAIGNQGDGYRSTGLNFNEQGQMTEEKRFLSYNNQGGSPVRTMTLIDMNAGTQVVTDDFNGIRINVNNVTSTTQQVKGYEQNGGSFNVQGSYVPKDNQMVQIGNGYSITGTIANGSPLTGTDQIIQIIQSNLLVNDDISTGPFGLNTNMVGIVSQIAVDTGKTVPLMRSLLLGTSVPQGSGGTITEHIVLDILGLPSFGGSVSNPTRIGIQDGNLLGSNFSDGATDAWFIKNNDPNTENHLSKLAIGTANKKVSNSSVALEVESTTKAVRFSNMTTTEKLALTALPGMQVFDTTLNQMSYYNGTSWINF